MVCCVLRELHNRIDIYFESHADALQFGVQTVTVEILQKEN